MSYDTLRKQVLAALGDKKPKKETKTAAVVARPVIVAQDPIKPTEPAPATGEDMGKLPGQQPSEGQEEKPKEEVKPAQVPELKPAQEALIPGLDESVDIDGDSIVKRK